MNIELLKKFKPSWSTVKNFEAVLLALGAQATTRHVFQPVGIPRGRYLVLEVIHPITVYKKCRHTGGSLYEQECLVTLALPVGAHVMVHNNENGFSKPVDCKARASVALVKRIQVLNWQSMGKDVKQAHASRESTFKYRVGKKVSPDYFDYTGKVCSGGIHFFFSQEDAKDYDFN